MSTGPQKQLFKFIIKKYVLAKVFQENQQLGVRNSKTKDKFITHCGNDFHY